MTGRTAIGLLASALVPLAWCLAIGTVVGGGPMIALEAGGVALAFAWVIFVVRELIPSYRLGVALAADARDADIFGVRVRVTRSLGVDAVVVGALRPRIYVGSGLLEMFSEEEQRAVLLHEEHHQRTRAPLRAAALGAWLRLLGRSPAIRARVLDRLADLETLADADAIRRGSSPRSLARALLKGDMSLQPASFAYAAERRVEQLLERVEGNAWEPTVRLPYEWLPAIVLGIALAACGAGL